MGAQMQLVALKPCPQGQRPGQVFEVPDAFATILIRAGAAKAVDADEARAVPRRRRYGRKDLTASA